MCLRLCVAETFYIFIRKILIITIIVIMFVMLSMIVMILEMIGCKISEIGFIRSERSCCIAFLHFHENDVMVRLWSVIVWHYLNLVV